MTDTPPKDADPSAPPERLESLLARPRPPAGRFKGWAPTRTEVLVLLIAGLCASNIALWIALRNAVETQPVTVVAVHQMTRDYMRKITTPDLSEAESVTRANLFIAAAQEELSQLIPTTHLVLARECVLSGNMDDITPELARRVEAKLSHDTGGLSDTVGSVRPSAASGVSQAGQQILSGHVSASQLLSDAPATSGPASSPLGAGPGAQP